MTRPRVIAHRGAPDAATPENTIAAFARAQRLGADMVELDVRLSRDGRLVIFHDHELAGVPVSALSHAELCARSGVEVPTLEQVLDWAAQHGMALDVELKEPGPLERVEQLLARHPGEILVTSFNDRLLGGLARLDPSRRTGLLVTLTAVGALARARACGAGVLVPRARLASASLLARAAAAGLDVIVWDVDPHTLAHTHADPHPHPHARLLHDPRIEGLITDDLGTTRAALG